MTETTERLSARSLLRLQTVIAGMNTLGGHFPAEGRLALMHARQAFAPRIVELDGGLASADTAMLDFVVIDRDPAGPSVEQDLKELKSRLSKGGVILLRKARRRKPWFGSTWRRRGADAYGPAWGEGADRDEQALRSLGLYIEAFNVRVGGRREHWLAASVSPFRDVRPRDHIGRVSRDFTAWSVLWPVTVFPGMARA